MEFSEDNEPACGPADKLQLACLQDGDDPKKFCVGLVLVKDGEPVSWIAITRENWIRMYEAGLEALAEAEPN